MGRLILVAGPNGSGKSLFAEQLTARTGRERFYIATMLPVTDNNLSRIEKHRRQRAGLGFETLELPFHVGSAPVPADSAVLLEDISNRLANAMFEKNSTPAQALDDICLLQKRCRLLVAVTIAGLVPNGCDAETAAYIGALNALNERLFNCADAVVRMEHRTPVVCKGELLDVF